jgi:very-short-patch-repair endonuclease/ribosomal protein S16
MDKINKDFVLNEKLGRSTQYEAVCEKCGQTYTMQGESIKKSIKIFDRLLCSFCKKKATSLQRLGVENPMHSKSVREKIASTNLKRYGNVCSIHGKDQRKQRDATFLEKYGTLTPSKCEKVKENTRKNNLEKYGAENPMQVEEIKEKVKKTNLERYGVSAAAQSEGVKEITRKSNLEKYGVDNPMKLEEIKVKNKAKADKARIEYLKRIDYTNKPIEFFLKGDGLYFRCKTCKKEWKAYCLPRAQVFRCLYCQPVGSLNSFSEYTLGKVLNKATPFKKTHKILKNKELDFYSESFKLAIEFDGIYWHSELADKDKNYHLQKTEECEQQGIRLIHVWENEWVNNEDLVISVLYKFLKYNQDKRIFARKCFVKEIDNNKYRAFCEENHLQGLGIAKVRLGLFHQDELVQVMSFSKPRYNSQFEWEMIRECSKQNYFIVGGKGKLLKYFERNYNPKSIISYCDRRWFTGESYLKLGFKLKEKTKPSYWYFKQLNNSHYALHNRMKFQKHKLSKIQGFQFDPLLTEWENMQLNGYNRIWDCGQLVFIKLFNDAYIYSSLIKS